MSTFGAYARYYDLLYRDKDYGAEAGYVAQLIERFAPEARTILDIGCGTGKHAEQLVSRGYELHGVDASEGMLREARARFARLPGPVTSFTQGDARTVRLDRKFDVVTSLFHVMSYQQTNDDLNAAFATVRAHLAPGGLFIFDCWYGPAVLTDRPTARIRHLEDDALRVTRVAEPTMHPVENIVDVAYHILMQDKLGGETNEVRELHRMRYLFSPELELLLRMNQLAPLHAEQWLTGAPVSFETWNACFAARG